MVGNKENKIVNVPIFEQDIITTLESLPRTPDEAGMIAVQLKRKKAYKNNHNEAFIRANLLHSTLITLMIMGHNTTNSLTSTGNSWKSVGAKVQKDGA